MNPKVDKFFSKPQKWKAEMEKLRSILLGFNLEEDLKWGKPCYVFQGSNVVILQGFKEHCDAMFFKGALMKDAHGALVKVGENSQAARQLRFTSLEEVTRMELVLKEYITEAIELEKAGAKVEFKKNPEPLPDELKQKFEEMPALEEAFYALTPGRQRAYILHFSSPKQSRTRVSRIEDCMQPILSGKGLNDAYEKKGPKYQTVEEYLKAQDATKERTLRSVIDFILAEFPALESKISWNVPTIHRNGKYVAGMDSAKNHLTFSAWSPQIIEAFKPRLENYVVFKNCFQVPVDWEIDKELVKDLVKARLAELD